MSGERSGHLSDGISKVTFCANGVGIRGREDAYSSSVVVTNSGLLRLLAQGGGGCKKISIGPFLWAYVPSSTSRTEDSNPYLVICLIQLPDERFGKGNSSVFAD